MEISVVIPTHNDERTLEDCLTSLEKQTEDFELVISDGRSSDRTVQIAEEHGAKFHKLARHSSIIHKLQNGWDFGDVYLQARHRHPSMTAEYAEFAGVSAPDWAKESPF